MTLFNHGSFKLHSGGRSNFLINSDGLWDRDLAALAALVAPKLRPFSSVYGIPRGGVRFGKALEAYVTDDGPRLLVDDVTTTGRSFAEVWEPGDKGVVIFNRGGREFSNILSVFHLDGELL